MTKPAIPPWEVLDKDGNPVEGKVQVQFGADSAEIWRIAGLVGERVARELRSEMAQVRGGLDARLTQHEKTAADAAELSAKRDKDTADALADISLQMGQVKDALKALTDRVAPLETAEEIDRRVRAELTGARPSPLVVMPQAPVQPAPPQPEHGLALSRWSPTHVVVLASIAAVVLTGATVDWASIIQQLLAVPTFQPPGAP